MRSISIAVVGAVALALAGCGSSVDKLFSEPTGGAGGTGADGGTGSTESSGSLSGPGGAGQGGASVGPTGTGAGSTSVGPGGSGPSSSGVTSGGSQSSGVTSGGSQSSGVSSGGSQSSGTGASGPTSTSVATSGSGGGFCSHDVCEVGEPLDPFCNECTMKIYQQDPSCSEMWWHDGCVYLASEQCGCFYQDCASCSEFLNGSGEPICPWSQPIVEELFSCACAYGCPYECGEACMGGGTTPECQNCVVGMCSYELQNCVNDF